MQAGEGSHFFSGAVRPRIANSTLAIVSGDCNTHYHAPKSERYGLRLLLDNIAKGAFHDAAERGDPPKCHPRTRLAIRAEIMEWIKLPEARSKLILWMYGPAGSGKTAIGQSIAEECKELGLLAASFFFSRTALRVGCNDTTQVAATIAYQISRFFPEVEDLLFTAIEQDPTIFSRALATQIKVLIIEPLKASPPSPKPIFVVLDGIDEIGPDRRSQANLLKVLGTAVSALQHIPLILLIASRPEYEIREAFNGPLSSLTQSLVLDTKYKPDHDIRLYFKSRFKDIRNKHLRLGSHFPSPWPSEHDVDRLVSKASGQFIFAATVTKFIDSVRHHPPDLLDIILGLSVAGNETPFALLDALYLHILSSLAPLQLPRVREILMILIFGRKTNLYDDLSLLEVRELLGSDVQRVLVDMHALLFVPSDCNDPFHKLRIYHASLEDFLTDPSRSQDFYIDAALARLTLTRLWSTSLANYQIGRPLRLSSRINGFSSQYLELSAVDNGEFTDHLACLTLGEHLEAGACEIDELLIIPWEDFFKCAKMQAGGRSDVFPRLQDEFGVIIRGILSQYPRFLQSHIPTIIVFADLDFGMQSDIATLLVGGTNPSSTKLEKILTLDKDLWYFVGYIERSFNKAFATLFQDRHWAGRHHVCDTSYMALAKTIVGIIFPKPGEVGQQVKLEAFVPHSRRIVLDSEGSLHLRLEDLNFKWLEDMLSEASADLELARTLHECTLRYQRDAACMEGWENIARASRRYIRVSTAI